jgi:hypothetical protein
MSALRRTLDGTIHQRIRTDIPGGPSVTGPPGDNALRRAHALRTTGASGLFVLSQSGERPER